ncbi:MAG TPA: DciA family protein [Azospira sp.]|nr:DciA family protein [Azospira sp.]
MPGQFPKFPDSLDHFLKHSEGAGRLMAHAKLLQKLARFYRDILPQHLYAASRVANFKSGTVVIHADNGAVAVKLRQMGPSLTREFSSRGIECTGVTVKVQALDISHQSRSPEDRPLPEGARRNLGRLAEGMPASPLREAIEQLLKRSLRGE